MLCCFFQYKYSIHNTSVYLNTNHIRKRREERIERRWWEQKGGKKDVKWKEAMRWKLVVFGVLLKQCATSSSTATSSLQLFQFPTIICLLQFPLTFFPSFTPLFSASHAARNKRQRGGNEMWIKDSSLFLSINSRRVWKKQWQRGKGFSAFFTKKSTDAAFQMWGWLDKESQISKKKIYIFF